MLSLIGYSSDELGRMRLRQFRLGWVRSGQGRMSRVGFGMVGSRSVKTDKIEWVKLDRC